MRVLITDGEGGLVDRRFGEEAIIIGSASGCSIHLPDLRIRPHCARVSPADKGTWSIERLDPHSTILVNLHALTGTRELHNGDTVAIDPYELKFYLDAALDHPAYEPETVQVSGEDLAKVKEHPLPPGASVRRRFDPISLTPVRIDQAARTALELADCRDIHELIEVALDKLLPLFAARAAWLGIRRQPVGELEVQNGKLASDQPYDSNPLIESLHFRCVDRSQYICIRKVRDDAVIGSALAVPLAVANGTLGMIYVDRRKGGRRFQADDLDLLSLFASHLAAKLEAVLQEQAQHSAAVSTTEISVVHDIQARLDPKNVPNWENVQLAAYCHSGQERPGDVYDVMQHPDLKVAALMLGHANATGGALALAMARLQTTFRSGFLHKDRPHALARTLSWLIQDRKDAGTTDALFLMLDPASGKIEYTRSGKIGAVIVNARGEPRGLQGADSPAIGQVPNYEYVSHVDQLAPGETLALYTRGVATCTNADGEKFSELRFLELMCDSFGETPTSVIQDLTDDLTSFFADGRHPDDITILLLRRHKEQD